ncbi:ABC transporter permease [Blastopirellula marina]|uniref:ABC transporter n=1 Tax=Blastopirellula marina TaxID=124 RepID=A0A2S8GKJ2_9BACT|nr:ABC transporter permease [Blastopirellula marina]PQO44958.1 ABC transporter [Blastopirellula marina]
MIRFLIRRAVWIVITLWLVYTLSFFLMLAVPGGPMSGERSYPPEIEKMRKDRFHLNDPWPVQYWYYLSNACRGDFLSSQVLNDFEVSEIIAQGFPISATLGVLAMSMALIVGLSAGIVSALWRNSLLDVFFRSMATIGIAVPNFVLAGLAIMVFVFQLKWFPAAGWGKPIDMVLPSICLAAPFAAYISRLTRTGMLDVLGQDYIRTAYAKGLMPSTVVLKHAVRGALLPVVSYLGPAVAGVLTGSLVIERIFFLPGLGTHFIEAVTQRDYTTSLGIVMVSTALVLVMNTLVDISYQLLDPRIKLK